MFFRSRKNQRLSSVVQLRESDIHSPKVAVATMARLSASKEMWRHNADASRGTASVVDKMDEPVGTSDNSS